MAAIFRVLEHSTLTIGDTQGEGEHRATFAPRHWEQLLRYHSTGAGRRYYDIQYQAVHFKHYVGVLQAGDLLVEVLPKTDALPTATPPSGDFPRWRRLLWQLLTEGGLLPVDSLHTAWLRERDQSLLDLYLQLFLAEIEMLLHQGLAKQYHPREGQVKALKGALLFGPHLAHNLVHQERFYTRHQTYDYDHLAHRLLRQALLLMPSLTTVADLRGRAARALLAWPDLPPLRPTAAHFARLRARPTRRSAPYQSALSIARLLLLHLSPDIQAGSTPLIALFFNMNRVWESYLLHTIRRLLPAGWSASKPPEALFWQAGSLRSTMQPDILLSHLTLGSVVLDAKWKRPANGLPEPEDLRQLFAYAQYYKASHTRLLYPQTGTMTSLTGNFLPKQFPAGQGGNCGISYLRIGALNNDTQVGDVDGTGYLSNSLADELASWLPVTIS